MLLRKVALALWDLVDLENLQRLLPKEPERLLPRSLLKMG
jgi:hypothetical protein